MPKTKQQKAKDRERRVAKKKLAERQAAREKVEAVKERDSDRAESTLTAGIQKVKQEGKAADIRPVVKAR